MVFYHYSKIAGCETEDGERCVFPFMYKQWRYRTCSTWENNGIPW